MRTTRRGDKLKLRKLGKRGEGKTIYSRRHARLWSTAMRGKRVLVTVMRGNPPRTRIVTVGRRCAAPRRLMHQIGDPSQGT